jgi:hypothetical protein
MENFKNHIKPFGVLKKKIEKDPMTPKYIKPDGTKVIEQKSETGTVVYEISPDCTLITRSYTKSDKLFLDYIRHGNLEIGHIYDEFEQVIYEFNSLYDEHNKFVKRKEIGFNYHDNGKKSREFIIDSSSEIKTEILYNENGEFNVKIEHRGTVKTYFDKDNKPFKREIDRGSGGIITEELS